MNPVELNYLFIVEGDENKNSHKNTASDRVQVSTEENTEDSILDQIFNI